MVTVEHLDVVGRLDCVLLGILIELLGFWIMVLDIWMV